MSIPDLIIPHGKLGTGTPWGNSRWRSHDECAKRYTLGLENKDEDWAPHPEGKIMPARCGSLFHLLAYYYYGPEWADGAPRLIWDRWDTDPDWDESTRLFSGYQDFNPRSEFTVLAREKMFHFKGEECEAAFGVPEFSGQWDLVVHVNNIEEFNRRWDLNLVDAGVYIVDFKTTSKPKADVIFWQESEQLRGYALAWDHLVHNDLDTGLRFNETDSFCAGTLVKCVNRKRKDYKKNKVHGLTVDAYWTDFVPPPSDEDREQFRNAMQRRALKRRMFGDLAVNTTRCFDWFATCPFLLDGQCDRTSEPLL